MFISSVFSEMAEDSKEKPEEARTREVTCLTRSQLVNNLMVSMPWWLEYLCHTRVTGAYNPGLRAP